MEEVRHYAKGYELKVRVDGMPVSVEDSIRDFTEFFETIKDRVLVAKGAVEVDFMEIAEWNIDLAERILGDEPDELLKVAAMAISGIRHDEVEVRLKLKNLPKERQMLIREIRKEHIDKLISISGLIIQTTDVRPKINFIRFECHSCGTTIPLLQRGLIITEPRVCSCGRKGKFKQTEIGRVDSQRLLLQEDLEALEGSDQPKRLYVLLESDLTTSYLDKAHTPGNKITIVGIIREIPLPKNPQSVERDLILEANNIVVTQEEFETMKISPEEEKQFLELAKDPDIIQKLVASFAPNIEGYDIEKEALIYALMSGRRIRSETMNMRGSLHCLLLGDPGSGKSQLLHFALMIAPKGRMIGTGSSGVGLTATVKKDIISGDWVLEAGAMVLADKGVLVWDEADKLPVEDTNHLHTGMADEQIHINKGGIHATLNTRTTVIAAANPKLGIFDDYEPIAKQFPLSATLMDRFDFIFPIKDVPREEKDRRVIKKMLESVRNSGVFNAPLSPKELKKYIAYARQHITPVFTSDIEKDIEDYFVDMRIKTTVNERAISNRFGPTIMKVIQAAAKTRLHQTPTSEDLARAKLIMNYQLMAVQKLTGGTGEITTDTIEGAMSRGKVSEYHAFKDILLDLKASHNNLIPIELILEEARKNGMDSWKAEETLHKLKSSGDVYEPRAGIWAVMT